MRATSHTRQKARDHCILRSLIGRRGWDHPSSLHTRRWRPIGLKETIIGWEIYVEPYMVCHILRQAHLHVSGMAFDWDLKALTITWSQPLGRVWSSPKWTWVLGSHESSAKGPTPLVKIQRRSIMRCGSSFFQGHKLVGTRLSLDTLNPLVVAKGRTRFALYMMSNMRWYWQPKKKIKKIYNLIYAFWREYMGVKTKSFHFRFFICYTSSLECWSPSAMNLVRVIPLFGSTLHNEKYSLWLLFTLQGWIKKVWELWFNYLLILISKM